MTRSFLLALIVFAFSAPAADAALLKFTLSSEVSRVDSWTYASPQPQAIEMSFTLDTRSGIQGSMQGGTGCLQSFSAGGAAFSNVSVRAGGNVLWTGSGANGGYGGQAVAGGCTDSAYSAYLDI